MRISTLADSTLAVAVAAVVTGTAVGESRAEHRAARKDIADTVMLPD